MRTTALRVGMLVALGFAAAACGQKGPLFLPEDREATEVQAPAPAPAPAPANEPTTEETKKKEEPR
jgi:predicted small lipoprotein YifL